MLAFHFHKEQMLEEFVDDVWNSTPGLARAAYGDTWEIFDEKGTPIPYYPLGTTATVAMAGLAPGKRLRVQVLKVSTTTAQSPALS